jgi:hypothetical protein
VVVPAALPSGTAELIRNSHQPASNFGSRFKKTKKTRNRGKIYCCGGAEESKEGDGDATATMAHNFKGGDDEEEENVDAAAALLNAVAPVGSPSAAVTGLYGEWRGYSESCCCCCSAGSVKIK